MVETWTQLGRTKIPNTHQNWFLERIKQANIKLLEWPSHSIDPNPIEHFRTGFKAWSMQGNQSICMS